MDNEMTFEALGGRKFRFNGKMHDPKTLVAWELSNPVGGGNQETLGGIRVQDIDVQTLKDIGAWDKLSPELQTELEQVKHKEKIEEIQGVHELMKKARAARKSKYANMPRELICTKCSGKTPIQPGSLLTRVEKIAQDKQIIFTVEDYQKQYVCQKCNPTKGRQPNPALAHLPKELTCKCGVVVACAPSNIAARAKAKGVTPEELVQNYVCQKCCPTKGKAKKEKNNG